MNGLELPNRFFMLNFTSLLKKNIESAYENAYDLSLKKQFSNPKIYTANGDLSKRWYVCFSYREPLSNKLKRQTPIYANANRYKTKEERLTILSVYRQTLLKLLKQGYNPYEDNTEKFYQEKQQKFNLSDQQHPISNRVISIEEDKGMIVLEAFDFDLTIKKKLLRDSSLNSYRSHINIFRQ